MNIKKKYNDFINIIDNNNKIILKKEVVNTKKILIDTLNENMTLNQLINNNIENKITNKNKLECICFTSNSNTNENNNTYENNTNNNESGTNKNDNNTNNNENDTNTNNNENDINTNNNEKNDNDNEKDIIDINFDDKSIKNNNIIIENDIINNINIENDIDNIENNSEIKTENKIADEFYMLFNNDIKIFEEEDLNSTYRQINNLEKMYNKIISKKIEGENILEKNNKNNKKNKIKGNLLKIICFDLEEIVFVESTRGFNIKENIFKIRMDKLKEKFGLYDIKDKNITIGYIYRNFNNPKSFINTDMNTHWLNISKIDNKISEVELRPKSKLLQSCLKNLATNNKFKKKINDEIIRAFKKTVEINNNLIIDIIFYTKNKIINI